MKKYIFIIGIVIISLSVGFWGYCLQSNNENSLMSVISVDIEAIAQDESGGIEFRCRCHNDNACYGGNAISFRPLCYKGTIHTDGVVQCHYYDSQCL